MTKQVAIGAFLFLAAQSLNAAPLTEARVNKIINQVAVVDPASGSRAATLNEVIKGQTGVKTGIKSRSELLFQDNTLTRIGPETFFSFTPGTRDLTLQEGTMLLQVPKGLGGAKIRTAAVTAAITGTTIMLEHRPRKHIKVIVLEGSLRLSVNGTFGDSLLLTPGKMVIMPPDAKRIPDPISVDLATVMKTSSLVKMSKNDAMPLPSTGLIQREIDLQSRAVARTRLIPTNLVINGAGTNVTMTDDPPAMEDVSRRQQVSVRSNVPTAVSPTIAMANPTVGNVTPATLVAGSGIDPLGSNSGNGNAINGNASNANGNGNGNSNGYDNGNGRGNGNGNQSQNGNGRGRGNGGPAPIDADGRP